jgi:hypothetical protein
MSTESRTPSQDQLTNELKRLRRSGLPKIDKLDLPALRDAARLATADHESADGAVIEATLRRAIARFGGGEYGDAAAVLFGLTQGRRTAGPAVRRELAAEHLDKSADSFRKRYEPTMLAQIATQILTLCSEQHTRSAREQLERRHPVESAMAVEWLRRFEAYYRMWTPASGLALDLTAYRSTLLDEKRPYDRRFGTKDPDDAGYSQDEQAEGYASFALYHYATLEWELAQFGTQYGGMWLLSDAAAEQHASDAIYAVRWHVGVFNERDQSYLRTLIAETPSRELHPFLERLSASELGQARQREWQEWVATCHCIWDLDADTDEWVPTHNNHDGIDPTCLVHQAIEACYTYCKLIDEDWRTIADWYHPGKPPPRPENPERLYRDWRSKQ